MSTSPTISVLLPTYNAEAYIRETVRSVLAQQGVSDFEVIIADDASSDATREIVESVPDDRLQLVTREENVGIGANTNEAATVAKGEILAFIDHDDVWRPTKLREHLNRHEATGSALVYSDLDYITSEGQHIDTKQLPEPQDVGRKLVKQLFEHSNFIPTLSCVTVTRKAWETVGGFDTSLSVSCDFDFYVRAARDWDFARVPEPMAKRRIHDSNVAHRHRPIYRDKNRIYEKAVDDLDRETANRYLSEMNRSRASWEFQTGNTREAYRFLKRSLGYRIGPKSILLGMLLAVDSVTGSHGVGQKIYDQYLDQAARRRQ